MVKKIAALRIKKKGNYDLQNELYQEKETKNNSLFFDFFFNLCVFVIVLKTWHQKTIKFAYR